MTLHIGKPDVCAEGRELLGLDAACGVAASFATPLDDRETVTVGASVGRILVEGVMATMCLPPFDQAAMDGYVLALDADSASAGASFPLKGRIAAGDRPSGLETGMAAQILTGAALPPGGNTVVMQEHTRSTGGTVTIDRPVGAGDNIRRRGEDVLAGEPLLPPGRRLDARHVALLSAQGLRRVSVRRRVRVGVLSTGNELRQPGDILGAAAVYDCNRPMIMALAGHRDLDMIDGGACPDDPRRIAAAIAELADRCDLVVTTGGASVGEGDHSASSAIAAGALLRRLHVAMKPGKPVVVGRLGRATYLGLPGNPVAALVSWIVLGQAVLDVMEGRPPRRRCGFPLPAADRFVRRPGRTEFAPARLVGDARGRAVEILGRGSSARLRTLAEADGLVEIDALHAPVEAGSLLSFLPFQGCLIN